MTNSVEPTFDNSTLRTHAIVAYVLMLLSVVSGGIFSIVGVVWAYIKRGEARGTIYAGHFSNIISTFWITLLLSIVGFALMFIFIGWIVLVASCIFFLFRMIKGTIKVMDNKAYQ